MVSETCSHKLPGDVSHLCLLSFFFLVASFFGLVYTMCKKSTNHLSEIGFWKTAAGCLSLLILLLILRMSHWHVFVVAFGASSIEYWPDPQRGIKEAYRVLKKGGKACLIGPVHPTFWLSRFFADVWMLFPTEEEYIDWFTKAGFQDVQLKRIGPKWYRGVRRHGLIMGCSVTGIKPESGDSPLQVCAQQTWLFQDYFSFGQSSFFLQGSNWAPSETYTCFSSYCKQEGRNFHFEWRTNCGHCFADGTKGRRCEGSMESNFICIQIYHWCACSVLFRACSNLYVAQGFGCAQGPTNLIVSNILKVCWTFIAAAWHGSGRGFY